MKGFTILTYDVEYEKPSQSPDIVVAMHKWILEQYFTRNMKDKVTRPFDLMQLYFYYEVFQRLLPESVKDTLIASVSPPISGFPRPFISPDLDNNEPADESQSIGLTRKQNRLREAIRLETMNHLQQCKDNKLKSIPTVQLRYNVKGLSTPILPVNLVVIFNQKKLAAIFDFESKNAIVRFRIPRMRDLKKKNKLAKKSSDQDNQNSVPEEEESFYNFDALKPDLVEVSQVRRAVKLKRLLYKHAYPTTDYHPISSFGEGDEKGFNRAVEETMQSMRNLINRAIKKRL